MALSNWDTLALSETGQPTPGVFTSALGVEVEVYKNWLYVRDKRAWREGGGFTGPTVMQVTEGTLRYQDVHIAAWRGPQEGVYAALWSGRYGQERGIVAAGVYGYRGEEWVGIEPESIAWLRAQLKKEEVDVPSKFRTLDWSGALRFNQGDEFFARALGKETPASLPGKPATPILEQMAKGWKGKKRGK